MESTDRQHIKACFQTSAHIMAVWERDGQLTVGKQLVRDSSAKTDVFIQIPGAGWDSSKGAKRAGRRGCAAIMYEKMHMIRVGPQQPEKC